MSIQAVAYVQNWRWESQAEYVAMLAVADSCDHLDVCRESWEALAHAAYCEDDSIELERR